MRFTKSSDFLTAEELTVVAEAVFCRPNEPVEKWWVFRSGERAYCDGQASLVLCDDKVMGVSGESEGGEDVR